MVVPMPGIAAVAVAGQRFGSAADRSRVADDHRFTLAEGVTLQGQQGDERQQPAEQAVSGRGVAAARHRDR
jgi:hypothetical protein